MKRCRGSRGALSTSSQSPHASCDDLENLALKHNAATVLQRRWREKRTLAAASPAPLVGASYGGGGSTPPPAFSPTTPSQAAGQPSTALLISMAAGFGVLAVGHTVRGLAASGRTKQLAVPTCESH